MVDEEERVVSERSLRSGFTTRLFDLAIAGGAPAEGLANRVAEVERSVVISWAAGTPIISWGDDRARDTREGVDALARTAFRNSPQFEKEASAWEERRSKQAGFNHQSVTGLFPPSKTRVLSAQEQAERTLAAHRAHVASSF